MFAKFLSLIKPVLLYAQFDNILCFFFANHNLVPGAELYFCCLLFFIMFQVNELQRTSVD